MANEWLERIFLKPFEIMWGKITGETTLEVKGYSRRVLLFKSDYILGCKMFTSDLLLNKRLMEEDMKEVRENTFLHEIRHSQQRILGHLTGISQLILSPPGLIIGIILAIALLSSAYLEGFSFLENPISMSLNITAVYLVSGLVSYIGELDAELFVIVSGRT